MSNNNISLISLFIEDFLVKAFLDKNKIINFIVNSKYLDS